MDRKEARAAKLRVYQSDRSCKNCGGFERYVSTGGCTICAKDAARRQKEEWAATAPPLPDVPFCLLVTAPNVCRGCDKRGVCPGADRHDVLIRAKLAFRHHEPVSASEARKLGMVICKPAQACRKCGKTEWRRLGARECLGCFERRLNGGK